MLELQPELISISLSALRDPALSGVVTQMLDTLLRTLHDECGQKAITGPKAGEQVGNLRAW